MLLEKRAEYQNGSIEKNQYFKEMFEIHEYLFEYPALLKDSPLKKIEITSDQVIFDIRCENNDIRICCDERDAHSLPMSYLNFSIYEAAETEMVLKLIKPGDVVFDIGANIGWYTLNILLKNKDISVYSFEPIKSSFKYLIKNLALNNQGTNKAYNIGFSDKNEAVKFYFDVKCAMASSMANLREDSNTVMEECKINKMDDFVSSILSLEKLDFIKCDVEGAELFVFKGGFETIKKHKPIVFTEILRKWSKKFGYHPNDIIDLFRSIDYECYVINNGKIERFGYVDDDTIQTNYLFFHKEKHADLIIDLTAKDG